MSLALALSLLAGCTPDETGYGDTDDEVLPADETDRGPEDSDVEEPHTDLADPDTDPDTDPDPDTDAAGGGDTDTDPSGDTDTDPSGETDTDTDSDPPGDTDTDGAPHTDDGPPHTDDTAADGPETAGDTFAFRAGHADCGDIDEADAPCDSGGACGEDASALLGRLDCEGSRPSYNQWTHRTCSRADGSTFDVVAYGHWWHGWMHFYDSATGARVAVREWSSTRDFCDQARLHQWWGPRILGCTWTPQEDETCGETDTGPVWP